MAARVELSKKGEEDQVMKFTKRSATKVAVSVAFFVAALWAPWAAGEKEKEAAQEIHPMMSGERPVVHTQHDVPETFNVIENPPRHQLRDLVRSPGGNWMLATAYTEVGLELGEQERRMENKLESVVLLLDENGNILREFGESSHDMWPRGHIAWAPDESGFVFIASPPRPSKEIPSRPSFDPGEYEPGSEEFENALAEHVAQTRVIDGARRDLSRKDREVSRINRLFRVDMDSFEKKEIFEIEGSIVGLGTGPEGDFHLALGGEDPDTYEPWYKVYRIGSRGEKKASYELPLIPDRARVVQTHFNAASTSFWFVLESGWPEGGGQAAYQRHREQVYREEGRILSVGPPSDRGRMIPWLVRIAYGPGHENTDWEFWLENARLISVDPSGKAVLYSDLETSQLLVLDVEDVRVTPVLPEQGNLPRPVAVLDEGATVRFVGHREGFITTEEHRANPLSFADFVLFDYEMGASTP